MAIVISNFSSSRWRYPSLLRETFSQGAIFVDNTADQLAEALVEMGQRHEELAAEMRELRPRRIADYEHGLDELRRALGLSLHD